VTRFARRPLAIAAVLLACAAVGYELLPREDTRIGALLNEVCTRLNQTKDQESLARFRQFLASALLPQISVRSAEFERELEGVAEVSEKAGDLLMGPPLSFALSSVEIKLSGGLARVDADLLVTVRGGGEQRRDLRRTRVRLAKHAERWKIEAVEIDAVAPSEPEARP